MAIAGGVLAVSLAVVFSPMLLDLGGLNKYVVVTGLIGVCFGLSVGLHALIDLLVRRR